MSSTDSSSGPGISNNNNSSSTSSDKDQSQHRHEVSTNSKDKVRDFPVFVVKSDHPTRKKPISIHLVYCPSGN